MSENTGQRITVKMVVCCPVYYEGDRMNKSALALISTPVIHSLQARRWFSPVSRCCKIHENFVDFGLHFCYTLFVTLCLLGG